MEGYTLFILQLIVTTAIIVQSNHVLGEKKYQLQQESYRISDALKSFIKEGETLMENSKTEQLKPSKDVLGLRGVMDAVATPEAYEEYARLLLEKVQNRYDKAFYKYFKQVDNEGTTADNYYLIQIVIEPDDFNHFIKMNRVYVTNNLMNDEVNRQFVKLLGEYIDLTGVKVLHTDEPSLPYSGASSIAIDSTVTVHIAFVREEEYPQVEADINKKIEALKAK